MTNYGPPQYNQGPQYQGPPQYNQGPPQYNQGPPQYNQWGPVGPPPPRRNNTALIIGLVVALVLVVGGVLTAILLTSSDDSSSTASATSTSNKGKTASETTTKGDGNDEADVEDAIRQYVKTWSSSGYGAAQELACDSKQKAWKRLSASKRSELESDRDGTQTIDSIENIVVKGDNATADVTGHSGNGKMGTKPIEFSTAREDGEWRVCKDLFDKSS